MVFLNDIKVLLCLGQAAAEFLHNKLAEWSGPKVGEWPRINVLFLGTKTLFFVILYVTYRNGPRWTYMFFVSPTSASEGKFKIGILNLTTFQETKKWTVPIEGLLKYQKS
jgi:hypothetical protein